MKYIPVFLTLLACCGLGWSQTNLEVDMTGATLETNAEPAVESISSSESDASTTNAPALIETHIYSDSVELGVRSRSAIYRGNVRLDDPRIYLTCEQLTADVPETGGRVEQVIAETNVVILLIDEKGLTNRAYADKAVYTYQVIGSDTNELVELTGDPDPRVERPEGVLYGNPIVWDRIRNTIRAKNQRMIYRGDPTGATNAVSATSTNTALDQLKAGALEAASTNVTSEPVTNNVSDE